MVGDEDLRVSVQPPSHLFEVVKVHLHRPELSAIEIRQHSTSGSLYEYDFLLSDSPSLTPYSVSQYVSPPSLYY